jgi:hypothetical protein
MHQRDGEETGEDVEEAEVERVEAAGEEEVDEVEGGG